MKFWRHSLVATITFIAVSFSVVYTSCTDDACTKLKCRNSGTCVDGFCKCPTGYEGTQCESKAVDRYTGMYDGTTTTDGLPPVVDSAMVATTYSPKGDVSATTFTFVRYTRNDDIITCVIGADGKVVVNDGKFGGRKITITEENNQLNFISIENNNGKEQTIKFVGTRRH